MTRQNADLRNSLPDMIARAEVLKNRNEFDKAGKLFAKALEQKPGDSFLIQRMALVTYKSRQPDAIASLHNAHEMLSPLKPYESGDPETLGLSGAIHKKLYEESGDKFFLEKALEFYKRGFSVTRDYYNGINLAYLYLLKAADAEDKTEARSFFEKAVYTNENIIAICLNLVISPGFEERNDKEFVYQSLAQAYLGLDQMREVIKLIPIINEVSKGYFDLDIFHEQNSKMIDHLVKFKKKFPEEK
jgi:tetratricopeptide (TPR) repeat protein